VIRGRQSESTDKTFLHRGIAARQFQRAFVLAEGIDVKGAELENGLLSIELVRPKAEAVVRTIDIKSNSNGSGL
jgi:HSP20 family molecular chaperone IbpA